MSSYQYTNHGSGNPSNFAYHDNSGYYGGNQDLPRYGDQKQEPSPQSFQPVRTYPSEVVRTPGADNFNWHMFRTAVTSCILCPTFCGIFGLIYALLSYSDYTSGNLSRYHSKKNCSLGWSITGIVLAVGILASPWIILFSFGWLDLLVALG
ncbi:uncharacterized protein [Watersipora subatra]|uniref:uncharacterized protein n=1 Tax=Watersipora subatra TaxID=2589382 RepID=UPI00355C59F1